MRQLIPAVPIPPPRAKPRALAFFLKNGQIPRGGDTSCLNAPGWGRRMRANAPPPGLSPSNTSAAFFITQ